MPTPAVQDTPAPADVGTLPLPAVATAAAAATGRKVGQQVGQAAGQAAASILMGFAAFLASERDKHRQWVLTNLGAAGRTNDVEQVLAQEMQLEDAFAKASSERVSAGIEKAMQITDPAQRSAAISQVLADEERYSRQRDEAMAARAQAAMTRLGLRSTSPSGAFWKLGTAQHHTPGCRFMSEKFWPWAVLDRVHPPRHYGCTSSLHSFGEALNSGWMTAGDVPDTQQAIRAAAGVVMQEAEADALIAEVMLREQLVEAGAHVDTLARVPFRGLHG
jgi:hypothetical protein